jgi:hypothetical protein|tara:strand:+ start:2680 stop:2904 length:225 start_codon:yes stop_codon:yes gene_type:complete
MEDFINTSFNQILSSLQGGSDQTLMDVNPFGLGEVPGPIYGEGAAEPLDTAVNPNPIYGEGEPEPADTAEPPNA